MYTRVYDKRVNVCYMLILMYINMCTLIEHGQKMYKGNVRPFYYAGNIIY